MNKYELGIIVRADLEEDGIQAELERVRGFIERFGGQIESVDDWGRRKLAYPILKLTEGFYSFINYEAESKTPAQVEDRLRLQENILRFMTIYKDPRELAAREAALARAAELQARAQAAREAARAAQEAADAEGAGDIADASADTGEESAPIDVPADAPDDAQADAPDADAQA